eukprot:m.5554 g.5554  ORF g.5554 m.5554 type:complete len:53 (-) comp5050_c0_seq1:227-385(-)
MPCCALFRDVLCELCVGCVLIARLRIVVVVVVVFFPHPIPIHVHQNTHLFDE